ncbi:MAG: DUF2080 family transposase-associated protein [Candidatus Methanoperedens sp.]|nr:DUF2080 family transposase-associated protein [Candidatus Methanoperedens sp.]
MKREFELHEKNYREKVVTKKTETASMIYLPVSWAGKKVIVILMEE